MSKLSITRLAGAALRTAHPSQLHLLVRDFTDLRYSPKSSRVHLKFTMEWLKNAHDAADKKGVSGGYSIIDGWLPPYPETTGYIIPTFYDYAEFSGDKDWCERAQAMTDWEIEVQMENGAVQAGIYRGKEAVQIPAVFNTGQVILGWTRAYAETGKENYLEAAQKAGNWLVSVQSENGSWCVSSQETETTVHAYDVRTAWSLLEIYKITKEEKYLTAAKRKIEWTLDQQKENGWFDNNAFFTSNNKWTTPFTHTIAYVMEGLLESYFILKDERYLTAVLKTAEKLLRIFELKKFMAGDYDENWKSHGKYSCLTGNAQIAGVWLKLFEVTDDLRFLNAALKLNDYTKSTQNLSALHKGIRGGIKGSHPLNGKYTPFVFPNWAAKFLADTLILEERIMKKFEADILNDRRF